MRTRRGLCISGGIVVISTALVTTFMAVTPAVSEKYMQMSVGVARSGNLKRALELATRAVWLQPSSAQARKVRGSLYRRLGDHRSAIADATAWIESSPEDAESWFVRGCRHHDIGSWDAAASDFTEAITRQPACPLPYLKRGYTYSQSGDWAKAIEDFTRVVNSDGLRPIEVNGTAMPAPEQTDPALPPPLVSMALSARALAWNSRGEGVHALKDAGRAIQLTPEDYCAYDTRGIISAANGDHQAAVRDFSRALDLNADAVEPLWNRANSHMARRDFAAARRDYLALLALVGSDKLARVLVERKLEALDLQSGGEALPGSIESR